MPTSLNCANLANAIAAADADRYPRPVDLALQIFALGQPFIVIQTSGSVYSDDYSGTTPGISPSTAGAIAIDSVTRQQFQWSSGAWT